MRMRWVDLLFAHWPMPVEALRPLVPPGLELDTFDGQAWLGIVPFRMEDVAPRFLPAVPGLGAFPELNVRTYVRRGRRRGVWFLSLDAASRFAVEGARAAFHLPYFRARMSSETEAGWVEYRSERVDRRGPAARFEGRYRPIGPVEPAAPGSLAAFLTDRRGLVRGRRGGRAVMDRDPPRPMAAPAGRGRDPGRDTWRRPTGSSCRPSRRCSISRSVSTSSPGGRGPSTEDPDGGGARSRLGGARPALEPRHQLGQLRRDVDRPRAEAREQREDPVAILVAHEHDDPRRIGPSAVRAGRRPRR